MAITFGSFFAQADDATQQALEDSGYGGVAVTAPTTGDEPDIGSFSSGKAHHFELVKQWLRDQDVPTSVAHDLVNQLGMEFYENNGRWPTAQELISDSRTMSRAAWANNGAWALPSKFGVYGADGRVTYYTNDPNQGMIPLAPGVSEIGDKRFRETMRNADVPILTQQELSSVLGGFSFGDAPRGGGGGGGRSASAPLAPPVQDRDALIEAARGIYRSVLLDSGGGGAVERMVDDYVAAYNSFFTSNDGARLDFDTFVRNRVLEHPRAKIIYQSKPDWMPHEQYLSEFGIAAVNAGTPMRDLESTTIAGAASGASVQGFSERLSKTAGSFARNQGTFSQNFANTVAQLGIRGT